MTRTKSIEKKLKLLTIGSLVLVISLFFLKDNLSETQYKLLLIAMFLLDLMVLVFISYPKKFKKILIIIFVSSLIYLPILRCFRIVRELFPKPSMAGSDWIGFANYFGYPLFFDHLFVFIIIFIPVMIYFVISRYDDKNTQKQN